MSRSRSKSPAFFGESAQVAKLSSVHGGFRAGKRKRSHSLTKVKPRAAAVAKTMIVSDEFQKVGEIKTVTYTRARP